MDALVVLIPLLPLMSAIIIAMGYFSGLLHGERGATASADMSTWTIAMSCLLALVLWAADLQGNNSGALNIGQWLSSGSLTIAVNFITTGLNVSLAALFSLLLTIIIHFWVHHLHNGAGHQRLFFVLSLFSSAMLWLVLSGNAVGTFIGWEIAGLCPYLLTAFTDSHTSPQNATRVWVTQLIGDVVFILGTGLSYIWVGSTNWSALNAAAEQLGTSEATGIALCFTIAALAKSAQLPFTPWLERALESPVSASVAIYGVFIIHAGVFLICLLEPIFERAPLAMSLLSIAGFLTVTYSAIVSLTQADVKNTLAFAISAQLGLMFLACGLGFWQWATWHLYAHAVMRCYRILSAPFFIGGDIRGHNIRPRSSSTGMRWAYMASLQRFWLDQITDWGLVNPVRRLGRDLSYFDTYIIDPMMGAPVPALRKISSLAQREEKRIRTPDNDSGDFVQGRGVAGKLTEWAAAVMHWFEGRLALPGLGKNASDYGRKIGHAANKFEQLIIRPRYLVLFVGITLLTAF